MAGITAEIAIERHRRARQGFRFKLVPYVPLAGTVALVVAAIFAPLLAPYNPTKNRLLDSMIPPAWTAEGDARHLLGTDFFGRDQVSRLIYGARISLVVSLSVIVLGATVGTTLGLVAGYYDGRWFATVIMRLVDIMLAMPLILMAIVLATILGPSLLTVILVVALLIWPRYTRQIRGEVLVIRVNDYITYARAAGTPTRVILFRHILPNVIPTLLVLCTLQVGWVIILESSLSFLGVGIPPPQASWGLMVSEGRGQLVSGWWISLFPGAAIGSTVLCLNTLGDWLRDRLDPKLRQL